MEDSHFKREDRDLLIKIQTTVDFLLQEIKSIKEDGLTVQKDHELRIRKLESWGAMAMGALFILELALKFFFK